MESWWDDATRTRVDGSDLVPVDLDDDEERTRSRMRRVRR
jgi:hypothetical protein